MVTPRNVPLVTANSPASRTVGCTSPRQSGWRFVHAGKISEPPARNDGGCVHENCASQSRVFSVNNAAIACGSKHDELVNVNSRVATFNRTPASSRPPPSPADKLVTASSGARQKPPHATERALSFSDSNCVSLRRPFELIRLKVGPPRPRGIEIGRRPGCAVNLAASWTVRAPHGVSAPGTLAVRWTLNEADRAHRR